MKIISIRFLLFYLCLGIVLSCTSKDNTALDTKAKEILQEWLQERNRLVEEVSGIEGDYEKSLFLRDYCSALSDFGTSTPHSSQYFSQYTWDSMGMAQAYRIMKSDSMVLSCAPLSEFYSGLLAEMGIPSMTYGFALDLKLSHVITLVEIETPQGKKIIVQDPTYALTYQQKSGTPLSFDSLLHHIYHEQFNAFFVDKDTVDTKLILIREILQNTISDNSCLQQASAYFNKKTDERVILETERHHDFMFKNPCDPQDILFREALGERGLPDHPMYTMLLHNFYSGKHKATLSPHIDSLLNLYDIEKAE